MTAAATKTNMTAATQRYRLIEGTLRRLRLAAPEANPEALRLLAETDVAAALLLTNLGGHKAAAEYNRLVEHRISLLTRLRLLPSVPRAKTENDDDDPYVQEHLRKLRDQGEKV